MKPRKRIFLFCLLLIATVSIALPEPGLAAAAKNPQNLEKAEKLFAEKKYALSKNAYDAYIKDNPKDYKGYFGRGKTWIKLFNNGPAYFDLNKAISIETKKPEIYLVRGELQIKRGEFESALKDLNEALKKGSPEKMAINEDRAQVFKLLGNHKQEIEELSAILAVKQTPALYKQRADAYYTLRDYENAIKDYSKTLESDPDSYKLLLRRGYCYEKIKDRKNAIADYTRILDKDERAYLIFERRAEVYYDGGDMEKALADVSKAIFHFRGYSAKSLYLLRAKIYKKMGQNQNAAKDYAKVNSGKRKKSH